MKRVQIRVALAAACIAMAATASSAQPAVLVKDIVPGPVGSNPSGLAVLNGSVYFYVTPDPDTGTELWRSDGTSPGTVKIKTVSPPSRRPRAHPVVANGLLFFDGTDGQGTEIWKSDGTTQGTVPVADICPGPCDASIFEIFTAGERVFFEAEDADPGFSQLWTSDGTAAGTQRLGALAPGGRVYLAGPVVDVDGIAFFSASESASPENVELWRSDGTPAGTYQVREIRPGTYAGTALASHPRDLTAVNGRVLFSATSGDVFNPDRELWTSDGTAAGTVQVKDINPQPAPFGDSTPLFFVATRDTVFFNAQISQVPSLWKSDGTETGTVRVKPELSPYGVFGADGLAYFTVNVAEGSELWRTDGSEAGTIPLMITVGEPRFFARGTDGIVYFAAERDGKGRELWRTDGTPEGTRLAADVRPGSESSSPWEMTLGAAGLYFRAEGDGGSELWLVPGIGTAGRPTLSVADTSVAEGHAGTTLLGFTVTMSSASISPVSVGYSMSAGTATPGSDYVARAGRFTIPANASSKTLVVEVKGDLDVEGAETLRVWLSDAVGATIERSNATGTIVDDDPATTPASTPMYRLYNAHTLEHLYTTDANEWAVLGARDWQAEGIAFRVLDATGARGGQLTTPLFRLYEPGTGQHLWSTDTNEVLTLSSRPEWFYEGITGYLLPDIGNGTAALYRMRLDAPPLHLWTTDLNEYDVLATLGWTPEGILGHALP
jgi:ELWxxDGT repeat protein